MATHFITSHLTNASGTAVSDGTGLLSIGNFDRVIVADGVLVGGTTYGIRTTTTAALLTTVFGDLYGSSSAYTTALTSSAPDLGFTYELIVGDSGSLSGDIFMGVFSSTESLRDPDSQAVIRNAGDIFGDVYVQLAEFAQVTNSGTIQDESTGTHTGVSNTLRFSAVGQAVLVNTGIISNSDATAVTSQALIYANSSTDTLNIVNSGQLISVDQAIYSNVATDEEIRNSGLIHGDLFLAGVGGWLENGGAIYGDIDLNNGNDTMTNAGDILGAVAMGDNNDRVENSGTIHGDISGGLGDDTLTNTGDIIGDLSLGDGMDVVESSGTIQGNIHLGGDNDSVILSGTGQVTGQIYGEGGTDVIHGSQYGDYVNGGTENDGLYGRGGKDTLFGGSGNDFIVGDAGNDALHGDTGEDTVIGGDGDDYITGDTGDDTLQGGAGNDTLQGQDDNDALRGHGGHDNMDGGSGNDMLIGNDGDDTLIGDSGFDTLYGNGGDDSLDGGGRADLLVGGKGDDTLTGGGSTDTFVIRRVGNGDDEVTDFQNGSDVVDISALGVQNFNWLANIYNALSQDGDSVIVDLAAAGGSGSIRLMGVTVADMDASDFIF